MPDNAGLQSAIEDDNNPAALAQVRAQGPAALPLVLRAYIQLDDHDYARAQWYNRLLAAIAPDPVGEALQLMGKVNEGHCTQLAWLLRRFSVPKDAARIRRALRRSVKFSATAQTIAPLSFVDFPRLAPLCEALGRTGDEEDRPLLELLLKSALAELASGRRDKSLHLFGTEVAPAAAAAAAGLLALAERAALNNSRERNRWRKVCVDLALAEDIGNSYLGGEAPPMPLLFMRAPVEAARFVVQAAQQAQPPEQLLSTLRHWLQMGKEQAVPPDLDLSVTEDLDWLDELQAGADPDSYGPASALDIRVMLNPSSALAETMQTLNETFLEAGQIAQAVAALQEVSVFKELAAIAVESFFVTHTLSHSSAGAPKADRALNRKLKSANLETCRAWEWAAPPGEMRAVNTPAGFHLALCAIANGCAEAARSGTPEQAQSRLAELQPLLGPALLKHAYYRNLLAAIKRAPAPIRETLFAQLQILREEADGGMGQAVLVMAKGLLGNKAGPVYQWLLDAPILVQNEKLAEKVVQALAGAPTPEAGDRIHAFRRKIAPQIAHGGDFGVNAAITEALGRLNVRAAAPELAQLIGRSGLGSRYEVAIMQLAARDPHTVDEATFARAFAGLLSDEYADLNVSLLGDQARAYLVQVLSTKPVSAPVLTQACRFLAAVAPKGAPPPLALPLLLKKLPEAMAAARAHPGEAWEDRNWGGYNASAEETTSEAMSAAIVALCQSHYSRDDWRIIIDELLNFDPAELTRVETAVSQIAGVATSVKDLLRLLEPGLLKVNEPQLEPALKMSAFRDALLAIRRALE